MASDFLTRERPSRSSRTWGHDGRLHSGGPYLAGPRDKLVGLLGQTGPLISQQADLAAQRQETSKRLQELLTEARRLGTFLRVGLKEHYGPRSEKLTTFKLQPFRGRKTAKLEEPFVPAAPASSNSTAP